MYNNINNTIICYLPVNVAGNILLLIIYYVTCHIMHYNVE